MKYALPSVNTKGSPKRGGRKLGVKNKVTMQAKEAIAIAAVKLGGAERLVAWAKSDPVNERAFWTILYPKLIPVQVNGPGPVGEHIVDAEISIVLVGQNENRIP